MENFSFWTGIWKTLVKKKTNVSSLLKLTKIYTTKKKWGSKRLLFIFIKITIEILSTILEQFYVKCSSYHDLKSETDETTTTTKYHKERYNNTKKKQSLSKWTSLFNVSMLLI